MTSQPLTTGAILGDLGAHPDRIRALFAAVPEENHRVRPDPDAWSAAEVFAHVRACADVWGGLITTILDEAPQRLPGGDPRAWALDRGYADAPFAVSFAAYVADRRRLLDRLSTLPPDAWARSAIVVGRSARVERSIAWHASHIARHEAGHLTQIRSTLASGSGDAEGRLRRR